MSKATKGEEKVLAQLDEYLAQCERPPPEIHVYRKQAASVVTSRKRHSGPKHAIEYLEFTHYKGIPVTIFEDRDNG